LKLVSGGDAAAPRARWAEVATSGFSSISRLPFGTTVGPGAAARSSEPAQTLQLFEFEACPFCRRVREAITDLDLEVDVFPTPKDSIRHRPAAQEQGGKLQFPLLIDPNTSDTVYESDAIVRHLYQEYGGGVDNIPKGLIRSTLVRGWVPTLLRAGRGMSRYEHARDDAPAQPLQLYDYDANQFSRLVREALCELELPYRRIACGKGSKRRADLQKAAGSTQVPYLVDPNTGEAIQDSEQAVRYLFATYASASTG
jgi:anaphase-promoting complex subunit 7